MEKKKRSIQEYRVFFDNMLEGLFVLEILDGEHMRVALANKSLAKMFGFNSPEECTGLNLLDFVDPTDLERVKTIVTKDMMEEDKREVNEFRAITRDGKKIWIEARGARIEYQGRPAGLISIQDITERKKIEERLRKSEAKYRTLMEATDDFVYLIDSDCRYLFMNKNTASRLGSPRELLVGRAYGEFHPPEEEKEFAEKVKQVFETGTVVQYEHPSHRDNRFFLRTLSPVKNTEPGKITAVVVNSTDITRRKQAEVALRKSEELYRSLVESTKDAIFMVDLDGRFLFVNKDLLSWFEVPLEEAIGRKFSDFLSGEAEFMEKLNRVLETGEMEIYELESETTDMWFTRTLSPVKNPETGEITAVTVVSKTITELKQTEENLRNAKAELENVNKELEAKNTELDKFTYTVSHDLKSPLFTMRSFVEMLRMDLEENERESVENDLKYIESGAAKMSHLLDDTLELSRIGRVANPSEDVPFGELAQDALEQTAGGIKASGVEVAVADSFPAVHVDRMRMVEVLVNLITNSIKYMGAQPHPKIDIGHREDDGRETVFFVQDNGMGVAPEEHEKVFGLFYKTDKNSNGTGAGLAIVKRIIEVHEGRIWIESEKGKGCTMCFTLPVCQEKINYRHRLTQINTDDKNQHG